MRVLIVFDGNRWRPDQRPNAGDLRAARHYSESDIFRALQTLGHIPEACCVRDAFAPLIKRLNESKPHIVFNCVETIGGSRLAEPAIVAALGLLGRRFTGCGYSALLTCKHKHLVHSLLQRHAIDAPKFLFAPRRGSVPDFGELVFPVLVKPASLDGSDLISLASYARSARQALKRMRVLHNTWNCDVIVEEFVEGRELYVGVIGDRRLRVFTPRELVIKRAPSGSPRFATYNLKWSGRYRRRWGAEYRNARNLSPQLIDQIAETVHRAYRLVGIDGSARFDIKLTPDGRIVILDVNPNPPMSRHDEFVLAAKHSGITYNSLVEMVLALGFRRRPS